MSETITPDKIREVQFISLIMTIEESAMYGLGKLANPVTQKAAKNFTQAKASIDMLEMLSEKTKGNLNDQEKRFLENTLTQLRLNYVEEVSEGTSAERKQEIAKEENINKDEKK